MSARGEGPLRPDADRRQAKEFRRVVAATRDRLRAALAASRDPRAVARELHMPLIQALMAFAGHPEGSRGQAWGSLVERATLDLERPMGEKSDDAVRKLVTQAEGLLVQVLGDMNSSGVG